MRRVQSLDVTATHVLEQIQGRLEENNGYLVFCDMPKGLPSGLRMKRFLKDTGVVRRTNKAFVFQDLDAALEWVETLSVEANPADLPGSALLQLTDLPLLAGQSPAAMQALSARLEARSIKAGKKVFKAGGPDNGLFIVRRGMIKISLPLHKKDNYHLSTAGPGSIIGAMGFIDEQGHSGNAVALTDAEVYALSRRDFDELAQQHGDLALLIMQAVARNLSNRLHVTIAELQALRG
jgi:SulP family sulfate permease